MFFYSLCFPAFLFPIVADFQPEQGKKVSNQGKTWQKLTFICLFLSTPRKIGDNERQKAKIYFKCGEGERLKVWPDCLPFDVSTGVGVQSFEGFRTCRGLALVLWSCAPCLCPFCRSACSALALNMALFRVLRAFLAGFVAVVWVCVVLVVCVACVAFVRVWS